MNGCSGHHLLKIEVSDSLAAPADSSAAAEIAARLPHFSVLRGILT